MVDELGGGVGAIFINQGERGGTGEVVFDAEGSEELHDECGFSGSHGAIEGEDGRLVHERGKLASSGRQCVFVGDVDYVG